MLLLTLILMGILPAYHINWYSYPDPNQNRLLTLTISIGWPIGLILWILGTVLIWIENNEMKRIMKDV